MFYRLLRIINKILINILNILISNDKIINSNDNKRIEWNEYFMLISIISSKRSSCSRLQVGCVIVRNNRIISMGYNGHLPKASHISIIENNHEICTVHAEQNAICDASNRGVSINNSSIYITHYPCINCLKMLISSGIKDIYYLNDYKNNKHIYKLIEGLDINITKISLDKEISNYFLL